MCCVIVQISDNPELFQPLVEENIRAANAGEIINDKVWGHKVRAGPAELHAVHGSPTSEGHGTRGMSPFILANGGSQIGR